VRPKRVLTLNPPLSIDPLLTRDEAAPKLHVSKATLVRMAKAGLISEIRLTSQSIRIRQQVLDDYLAARSTPVRGGAAA